MPKDKEPLLGHRRRASRSTGPQTPEGKERSSQNARKHGCTSRKLILPGESQEEFEALRRDWLEDFQPAAPTAVELVEQTAQAHWLYLRVVKQCDLAEAGLENQNPLEWSEQQWKLRERMGRYRTAAERSFHRALGAIEARRKSRNAEFHQAERMEQAARRIELQFLRGMEQKTNAEAKLAFEKEKEQARQAEWKRRDHAAPKTAEPATALSVKPVSEGGQDLSAGMSRTPGGAESAGVGHSGGAKLNMNATATSLDIGTDCASSPCVERVGSLAKSFSTDFIANMRADRRRPGVAWGCSQDAAAEVRSTAARLRRRK